MPRYSTSPATFRVYFKMAGVHHPKNWEYLDDWRFLDQPNMNQPRVRPTELNVRPMNVSPKPTFSAVSDEEGNIISVLIVREI